MTAPQTIIKEAKSLRKQYPKRYSKWTDYVKQASAIYASKHKNKSIVSKKKATKIKISGVKKKKIVRKAVKKSATLTKVKSILKKDHVRLKHGYNLTNGNVRIGACSQMSLKHYQDICNKINNVEENIIDLKNGIKDKTKSLRYRKASKEALIEDKKYLRELKIQKTEIKKLL